MEEEEFIHGSPTFDTQDIIIDPQYYADDDTEAEDEKIVQEWMPAPESADIHVTPGMQPAMTTSSIDEDAPDDLNQIVVRVPPIHASFPDIVYASDSDMVGDVEMLNHHLPASSDGPIPFRHIRKNGKTRKWMLQYFLRKNMSAMQPESIARKGRPTLLLFQEDAPPPAELGVLPAQQIPKLRKPEKREKLWLIDADAARERRKFIRQARKRGGKATYDRSVLPAALRDRRRERYIHYTEYCERFESTLLKPIMDGNLHEVMRQWAGERDLAFYLLMGRAERSHPILTALHHFQLDIFAFFIAVGCDITQKGTVHPYSGDNLSSERDRLQQIRPQQLWRSLMAAHSLDGNDRGIAKQLTAFEKFFKCPEDELLELARQHMWRLKRIYAAGDKVLPDDKAWLQSHGKRWTSYAKKGKLPETNKYHENLWTSVLTLGGANPALAADVQGFQSDPEAAVNVDTPHHDASLVVHDLSDDVLDRVHEERVTARSASILMTLGQGLLPHASAADWDGTDPLSLPEKDGVEQTTVWDPFYYPAEISRDLTPLVNTICDHTARGTSAVADDISGIVWGWLRAYASFAGITMSDDDDLEPCLATPEGMQLCLQKVVEFVCGHRIASEVPLNSLLTVPTYRDFIERFTSKSDPSTQDHPLLHAVHEVRPAVVSLLLQLGCSPTVAGTIHPWSGDDFSVVDLQAVTPVKLAKEYLQRMKLQGKRKWITLLSEISSMLTATHQSKEVSSAQTMRLLHRKTPARPLSRMRSVTPWLFPQHQTAIMVDEPHTIDVESGPEHPQAISSAPLTKVHDPTSRATVPMPARKQQQLRKVAFDDDGSTTDSDIASDSSASGVDASTNDQRAPQRQKPKTTVVSKLMKRHKVDPMHDDHPEYAIDLLDSDASEASGITSTSYSSTSSTGGHLDDAISRITGKRQPHRSIRLRGGLRFLQIDVGDKDSAFALAEDLPSVESHRISDSHPRRTPSIANSKKGEKQPTGRVRHRPDAPVGQAGGPSRSTVPHTSAADTATRRLLRKPGALPAKLQSVFGSTKLTSHRPASMPIAFEKFAAAMAPSIYDPDGVRRLDNQPSFAGSKRPREKSHDARALIHSTAFVRQQYFLYLQLLNRIEQLRRWESLLVAKPRRVSFNSAISSLERASANFGADALSMLKSHAPRANASVGTRIAAHLGLDAFLQVERPPVSSGPSELHKQHFSELVTVDVEAAAADHTRPTGLSVEPLYGGDSPARADDIIAVSPSNAVPPEVSTVAIHQVEPEEEDVLFMTVPPDFFEMIARFPGKQHLWFAAQPRETPVGFHQPWEIVVGGLSVDKLFAVSVRQADGDVDALPVLSYEMDHGVDESIVAILFSLQNTIDASTAVKHLVNNMVPMYLGDIERAERLLGAKDLQLLDDMTEDHEEVARAALLCIVATFESIRQHIVTAHPQQISDIICTVLEGVLSLISVAGGLPKKIVPSVLLEKSNSGGGFHSFVVCANATLTWYALSFIELLGDNGLLSGRAASVAATCARVMLRQHVQLLLDFPVFLSYPQATMSVTDSSLPQPVGSENQKHAPALCTLARLVACWDRHDRNLGLSSILAEASHSMQSECVAWFIPFLLGSADREKAGTGVYRSIMAEWRQSQWELLWELSLLIQAVKSRPESPTGCGSIDASGDATSIHQWAPILPILGLSMAAAESQTYCVNYQKRFCALEATRVAIRRAARVMYRLYDHYAVQLVCNFAESPDLAAMTQQMQRRVQTTAAWLHRFLPQMHSSAATMPPEDLKSVVDFLGNALRAIPRSLSFPLVHADADFDAAALHEAVTCRPVQWTTVADVWSSVAAGQQGGLVTMTDPRSLGHLPEWLLRAIVAGMSIREMREGLAAYSLPDVSRIGGTRTFVHSVAAQHHLSLTLIHGVIVHALRLAANFEAARPLVRRALLHALNTSRSNQIVCMAPTCAPDDMLAGLLPHPVSEVLRKKAGKYFSGHLWAGCTLVICLATAILDPADASAAKLERITDTLVDVARSDPAARLLFCQAKWAVTSYMYHLHHGFQSSMQSFATSMATLVECSVFDMDCLKLSATAALSSDTQRAPLASALEASANLWRQQLRGHPDKFLVDMVVRQLAVLQSVFDSMNCMLDRCIAHRDAKSIGLVCSAPKVTVERVDAAGQKLYASSSVGVHGAIRRIVSLLLDSRFAVSFSAECTVALRRVVKSVCLLLDTVLRWRHTGMSACVREAVELSVASEASAAKPPFPNEFDDFVLDNPAELALAEGAASASTVYGGIVLECVDFSASLCTHLHPSHPPSGEQLCKSVIAVVEKMLHAALKSWIPHAIKNQDSVLESLQACVNSPAVWAADFSREGTSMAAAIDLCDKSDEHEQSFVIGKLISVLTGSWVLKMECSMHSVGDSAQQAARDFAAFVARYACANVERRTTSSYWEETGVEVCHPGSRSLIARLLWPTILASLFAQIVYHPLFSEIEWTEEHLRRMASISAQSLVIEKLQLNTIWRTWTSQTPFSSKRRPFFKHCRQLLLYNSGMLQTVLLKTVADHCEAVSACGLPQEEATTAHVLRAGLTWVFVSCVEPFPTESFPEYTEQLRFIWSTFATGSVSTFANYEMRSFKSELDAVTQEFLRGDVLRKAGMVVDGARLDSVGRLLQAKG